MTRAGDRTLSPRDFDAVVFDMDGVITRTADVHARAWKQVFDAFLAGREGAGERPFEIETDYRQQVDGKPRLAGVRDFLASRGIDLPEGEPGDGPERDTVHGLARRKNDAFLDVLQRDGARPFEDTLRLVDGLRRVGIRVGVISSSRNAAEVLAAAGVADLFETRVDGVEAARLGIPGKPAPDVFLEAARRLGAGPSRTAIVEDAESGVQAGAAGGFALVVGVDRTGDPDSLLRHGADVVVRDLTDLLPLASTP